MAALELEEAELVVVLTDRPTDKPTISVITASTTKTMRARMMYFCIRQKGVLMIAFFNKLVTV